MRLRFLAFLPYYLLCCAMMGGAYAGCSRPIIVPASPAGKFVITQAQTQTVSGVYPDLLRSSGKKIGCEFDFVIVPRARFNFMLEKGTGHLFIPESQTPERDLLGEFVPLFYSTPVIISARPDLKIRSIADLKRYPELRVNVVRGYDWGVSYRNAVQQLRDLGMVEEVVDAAIIVKKMDAGRADITIMSAHILYGNVLSLGLEESLGKRLRYIRSPDFEPIPSGVYLSNSLEKDDRILLKAMLTSWLNSKSLWAALFAALPADGLMSLTPLDKKHRPRIHVQDNPQGV